jgi:hypothetical protein
MKKNLFPVCIAGTAIVLSSCSDIYYAPNSPHLPMVKEKSVTEANVSLGAGETAGYFDLNLFHSVSHHVGLMLNYSSFANIYTEGNSQSAIDIGAGYFTPIGEKGGFEIYSTIGYGSLGLTTYDSYSFDTHPAGSLSSFRFSIQPDIFFTTKHFEAGFGVRIMSLSMSHPLPVYDAAYSYNGFGTSSDFLMLEPTIKLTVGGEKVKFSVQGTYSGTASNEMYDYDPYNVSLGIAMKFYSSHR